MNLAPILWPLATFWTILEACRHFFNDLWPYAVGFLDLFLFYMPFKVLKLGKLAVYLRPFRYSHKVIVTIYTKPSAIQQRKKNSERKSSCCLPFKHSIKIYSWGSGNQIVTYLLIHLRNSAHIALWLLEEMKENAIQIPSICNSSVWNIQFESPLQFNNVRRILNEKAADLRMIQKFLWQCQRKIFYSMRW